MTHEEYSKIDGITATAIKAGAVSMKHMRAAMTGPAREETPAMRWGRLVHLAVLEPDEVGRRLFVYDGRRAGKEWEAVCADHSPAWIVKTEELAELMQMSNSVHGDPDAHRIVDTTYHEVLREWDGTYGKAKCRADMVDPERGMFADLKTTSSIQLRRFAGQFFGLGYDLQFGWYQEGLKCDTAYCIALESTPPYDVAVLRIPENVLLTSRKRAVELAIEYRCCEVSRCWPGVCPDGIVYLEPPAWLAKGAEVDVSKGTMEASEL